MFAITVFGSPKAITGIEQWRPVRRGTLAENEDALSEEMLRH